MAISSDQSGPPPPGAGASRRTAAGRNAAAELPESRAYRLKRRLLGPPLVREQLADERLSNPVALAVLSSDVLSSSAYATEQILTYLVPAVGLAAFAMVVPVTLAILVVLVVVTMSYREVVRAYPKAGGAYVVSRENFGPRVAQIASASLLVDYVLTVAVSVAAGVDALASAAPALNPYITPISVAFVLVIAYGNLRGIREAGRSFALPTFFFVANMGLLMAVGIAEAATGGLHAHGVTHLSGSVAIGRGGGGLFAGASLFIVLRAFASGGSALTGTEAISNGVSVFRDPQSENARKTLLLMATILGSMFLGLSALAAVVHPVPFLSGTPTVISQVAKYVYGTTPLGHVAYYSLQAGTMLILILAANTSFTGFPFLASFAAQDGFLPRQLTRRGHRLVFSNGIVVLTVAAVALLIATDSKLNSLIALYAIGVFTGFTMSGFGMAKHELTHKRPGWKHRLAVTTAAGVLSLIVDAIFVTTKFGEGAWVVVVLIPVMVVVFVRLNRQYQEERATLSSGASEAAEAPVLRRHVVLVLVDELDMAAARAIQYARTLNPDEVRAVHFLMDARHAEELQRQWTHLGLSRLPLEVIDTPDRRLTRAALEVAADAAADGQTEVTILLPRRAYARIWDRVLHDQTADRIAGAVSQLDHVNATIVPFHVHGSLAERAPAHPVEHRPDVPSPSQPVPAGTVPIAECGYRQDVTVAGRVRSVRVQPWGGVASLEATLVDGSGDTIAAVFLGRRRVPGIQPGARLAVTGRVGNHHGRRSLLNPRYEILAPAPPPE